jgi:hypothetical protein
MKDSFLPDISDSNALTNALASEAATTNAPTRSPWWQVFLTSTGGTAIITVIIGGLIGTGITAIVQSYQKDREFQAAWMKTRGDQALTSYGDYLSKEQETMTRAFKLIGETISAADDMIEISTPDWNPAEHPQVTALRKKLVEDHNVVDKNWRGTSDELGLLVSYYHYGQANVTRSWYRTQDAVNAYKVCAGDRYKRTQSPDNQFLSKDGACQTQRENLRIALTDLNENIDKGRRFVWQGWDSLACQKGLLDKVTCASILKNQ